MKPERTIWTCEDVAKRLRVSRPHVIKLVKEQGLPGMRLGRCWRFRREDVLQWEAEQAKKGAA